MANLSANETALQTELYLVKRELEAVRDEKHALRCYLKAAEKQAEEACKKVGLYMDEVETLRAEIEVLRKSIPNIKAEAGRDGYIAGMFDEIHQPSTVWCREKRVDAYANQLRKAAKGRGNERKKKMVC